MGTKFNTGDKVIIRTNLIKGDNIYRMENGFGDIVNDEMMLLQGKEATIVSASVEGYDIDLDNGMWLWTDEMFQ